MQKSPIPEGFKRKITRKYNDETKKFENKVSFITPDDMEIMSRLQMIAYINENNLSIDNKVFSFLSHFTFPGDEIVISVNSGDTIASRNSDNSFNINTVQERNPKTCETNKNKIDENIKESDKHVEINTKHIDLTDEVSEDEIHQAPNDNNTDPVIIDVSTDDEGEDVGDDRWLGDDLVWVNSKNRRKYYSYLDLKALPKRSCKFLYQYLAILGLYVEY